jgi:acetyltransferase-like isoleucine patch superfamily enzyme
MNTFLSLSELEASKFGAIGHNVMISRHACIYEPALLLIGDNVRIDDFCILSGKIELSSNIHISAYCALYGKYGIKIDEYSGLSPRCTLFSASDDFSGDFMIGPMVPDEYTRVCGGKIHINRLCQIGAGSIIMPGTTINEGVAVGAMSFVKNDLPEWGIYIGNPAHFLKARGKGILEKYDQLRNRKARR